MIFLWNLHRGDPSVLISDNHKILSVTQWRPQYDQLETICKSAYLWEEKLKREEELKEKRGG